MSLDPAPILAVLVGAFHTALFVLIRGSAGGQLPLLLGAAILGAWAGDALGDRIGDRPALDRRFPAARGVAVRVGRDRVRGRRGHSRPDEAARMSDRDQGLVETVREALRGEEGASSGTTFMRGLTLGALIGAAVAGSAIWQRRGRRRLQRPATDPDIVTTEAPVSDAPVGEVREGDAPEG